MKAGLEFLMMMMTMYVLLLLPLPPNDTTTTAHAHRCHSLQALSTPPRRDTIAALRAGLTDYDPPNTWTKVDSPSFDQPPQIKKAASITPETSTYSSVAHVMTAPSLSFYDLATEGVRDAPAAGPSMRKRPPSAAAQPTSVELQTDRPHDGDGPGGLDTDGAVAPTSDAVPTGGAPDKVAVLFSQGSSAVPNPGSGDAAKYVSLTAGNTEPEPFLTPARPHSREVSPLTTKYIDDPDAGAAVEEVDSDSEMTPAKPSEIN